jgi:predicted dehydrogenase
VRTLGFTRTSESPEALIENDDIDIVVVCTRHSSHAELVVRALTAGKHVFCEKPLALTEDELDAVLQAEESAAGVLGVGFNRRFSPLLGELKDSLLPQPLTAVYRVAAGRLPADHWTHDINAGGGRVLGEGCHFIDTLAYLVGHPVAEVHATGYGAPSQPVQAHDNVIISLRFADGSVGAVVYVSDGSGAVGKERLEVFSGARTLLLDDYQRLEIHGGGAAQTKASRTQDKGHYREVAHFVDAARRGESPVDIASVRNVSFATLAAVESMRTSLPVRVTR